MSKKPKEPDEMRMPADEFDEVMRQALGVPAPQDQDVRRRPSVSTLPKSEKLAKTRRPI